MKATIASVSFLLTLLTAPLTTEGQIVWQVGRDDEAWPAGDGGGPNASFVQENGTIQPLPGSPTSPEVNQQADNDYYFAGSYIATIASVIAYYGDYAPVGDVPVNEEAAERAFAGNDNDLRYHFNLPDTLGPNDLLSVTFDSNNLHTDGQSDPRYGIEVYFNGVLVQPQITIRPSQLNIDYTTPQFTLASVNAQTGPGADNIVSLKGISYANEGGGAWMGIDYVQLNNPTEVIPPATFPWAVGKDDNDWPMGDGGGPNTSFVQENGTIQPLPGSPTSPEVHQQADNDYYFAGSYTTPIASVVAAYGPYTPVGLVPVNEEAAERAFAGGDNDLRYHFNLPNTASPNDLVAVTFEPFNLDETGSDPRYGVEVYFNGVLVQPQIVVRADRLGQAITTPAFTLGSVNAAVGAGGDNIVSLKGINYGNEGGGQWMGIDYIQLNPSTVTAPPPILPWSIGKDDNGWPEGNGGEANASFVQPDGFSNALPGSPINEEFPGDPDDDYYLAGAYTSVVSGNGNYVPVGIVQAHEEGMARGFEGADNTIRIHFNLPSNLRPDDLLTVTFDALNLDMTAADPRYGVEISFNGVVIQPQVVIRPAQLGQAITTPRFTAASVRATPGSGFDNIITLRGISYSASGGGSSLGLDYIRLVPIPRITFPWAVGRDDDAWPAGDGGGPNTSFVQETGGINPLPGRPNNPEVNQQSDNDYYFAGEYSSTIPSVVARYGAYTPIGLVLANEEGAERAFAAADNDLRYHFNLPTTLQPTDKLAVTFDANNLHTDGIPDPRYGIEVWFNGVMVQSQITIRPPQLGIDYTTPAFTLASVNARTGLGADNIVSLRGINYNNEGGGNWMGIDYVQLNPVVNTCPTALPLTFSVNQGGSTSTNLPATDPDGNPLTYTITQAAAQGTVVLNPQTGAITYTASATFCGNDTFKFKANDGTCDSAEATVTVRVINCNQCPTASGGSVTVDQGSSVNFNLQASDPDGNALQYIVTQGPSRGTLVVNPQTGAATYTPAPGACGADSFRFKVNDGRCDSAEATVSITVRDRTPPNLVCPAPIVVNEGTPVTITPPTANDSCDGLLPATCVRSDGQPLNGPYPVGTTTITCTAVDTASNPASCSFTVTVLSPNRPPNCVASVTPQQCGLTFPSGATLYVIAVNKDYVCVTLDGSGSTDPDGDPLTVSWVIDGTTVVSGAIVTQCLDVGCHTITMTVSDGRAQCQKVLDLCVITPSEAVEQCIKLVDSTQVERKNKRPLIVSLKAAAAAFDRQGLHVGAQMLRVFEHKVNAQIARQNPDEAAMFIQCAENILNALECVIKTPRRDD